MHYSAPRKDHPNGCQDYHACLLAMLAAFRELEALFPAHAPHWDTTTLNQYNHAMLSLGVFGETLYRKMTAAAGVRLEDGKTIFT